MTSSELMCSRCGQTVSKDYESGQCVAVDCEPMTMDEHDEATSVHPKIEEMLATAERFEKQRVQSNWFSNVSWFHAFYPQRVIKLLREVLEGRSTLSHQAAALAVADKLLIALQNECLHASTLDAVDAYRSSRTSTKQVGE